MTHPEKPQVSRHKVKNNTLEIRWKVFNLTYQFSEAEKITDIPKRADCFCQLVLLGAEE